MKLKKATNIVTGYPTRESIKPILLSVSVAVALTACTPGAMPNNTQGSDCYTPVNAQQNQEINPPENIAGYIPEENNQTWGNTPKK